MSDDGTTTTRPWYRDPTRAVPLLVLLVGLPLTINQIYKELLMPDPPAIYIQYVLDVSEGMAGKLGNTQKLTAATDEIVSAVSGSPTVAHALRLAGPGCSDAYERPHVDFAQDNAEEFSNALASAVASGRTDFARSVQYAVDDLNRSAGAGTRSVALYFLVGGNDRCTTRPDKVISESLKLLDQEKVTDVSFKFIGVKAPKQMRKLLSRTRKEARRRDIPTSLAFVNNAKDLKGQMPGPPRPSPEDPQPSVEPQPPPPEPSDPPAPEPQPPPEPEPSP